MLIFFLICLVKVYQVWLWLNPECRVIPDRGSRVQHFLVTNLISLSRLGNQILSLLSLIKMQTSVPPNLQMYILGRWHILTTCITVIIWASFFWDSYNLCLVDYLRVKKHKQCKHHKTMMFIWIKHADQNKILIIIPPLRSGKSGSTSNYNFTTSERL